MADPLLPVVSRVLGVWGGGGRGVVLAVGWLLPGGLEG